MTDSPQPPPTRPRRRRLRRAGLVSLALMLLLVVTATMGAVYVTGRPITAPEWIQQRIEARIAQELPNARVRFGEMVVVMDEGWVPRVRLRDVTISTPQGVEILSLNEFKATFALGPLFDGVVQPRTIALSGIFASLTRDAEGRVSLSAGSGAAAPAREAATLAELVGQVDAVLKRPALSALASVDLRALTLRYEDKRADRAWTVDGGRLLLNREGDDLAMSADLAVLSGGAGVATLSASYSTRIGTAAADFGVSFEDVAAADIAAQGPAFAWLQVLRADISGSVRSGLDDEGRFAPLNATLHIGAGAVQPNARTKPIPFDGARSYFSYDPGARVLRFDEVSVQSKWVSGQATGTATLGGTGNAFTDLVGQFALRNLTANPQDLYPEPVTIAEADLDFQLKLDPFRVQLGRLQITDQGSSLQASGGFRADPDGWRLAIDAIMDALTPARLLTLWPEGLKPKSRTWLAENVYAGRVENADFALRLGPDIAPRSYIAFDYRDAQVQFLKTMPPIDGGKGHFSLIGNRLVVALDGGSVEAPEGGAVDVTGSSFIIPDVRVKDGPPAVVRLATRSSVTAVLSLLNQPPLRVMDKVNLPVALADGQAVLAGTLSMPLKKGTPPSAVRYHMTGDLLGVDTDTLVQGRSLTAERLSLTADNENLTIGGAGRLDGVAFEGTWAQPIGPGSDKSALRGEVALSQSALDAFGIALPPGTVRGEGTGSIALDFERGTPPRFVLGSDLRGIRVSVPQLSWSKAPGTAGKLSVSGQLGPIPDVDTLLVEGPGLSARGSVALADGGRLERVRFDQLRVGGWLDVPVDLVGQGKGRPVQVVLRGGRLDLRGAEFGNSPNPGPPGPPMQIALERLQITDTIALTGLQGSFTTAGGLDGAFEARLNGGTPVQGRVVPQNERSAVRLTSADAGGVVRSAGLLKQIVGGDLSLTLLPVGTGGAYDGRVRATGVRVKNAPGIAALLNAISVVGLVNEMNGDGIWFDEVEGDFRLTSDRLTLTKASAVGASMGLSMDGVYALESNRIQMQGVITPVYLLNGVGSVLTRKGEGLFGFNYALTGPAKDPQVSVNPLSALAPGMFREILRAPPPQLPSVEGVTGSVLPQVPETSNRVVRQQEGR